MGGKMEIHHRVDKAMREECQEVAFMSSDLLSLCKVHELDETHAVIPNFLQKSKRKHRSPG
jgi:hypothetical protein